MCILSYTLHGNTTVVSYVSKMGNSPSFDCNQISKEIWVWCYANNIWLTASKRASKKLTAFKAKGSVTFEV